LPLVKSIRDYHKDEMIIIVDSSSGDKSYFDLVKHYNVIIEDINNNNWCVGAFWHSYLKYPDEEYYYFLHDSMIIKNSLDEFKNKDLVILATFSRQVSSTFNHWNYRIEKETNYKNITNEGNGCYGPLFFCKNKVIKSLYDNGANNLLPSCKAEIGYMEGAFGVFFEQEGYNLRECSLYGDILELESKGGKSGPYPHNTSWQYPIEKMYGSHNGDKNRL
jgi:hypothetical protein